MKYNDIAIKIISLKNADLKLRDRLIQEGQLGETYNAEMAKMHKSNTEKLDLIIEKIDYPTIDKVGKEASEAAWLIIQHSIAQPDFMRKCAKLLEQAVKGNKANPISLAYLKDRIATFEGTVQLYGTQFDWDKNGELSPNPFDDLSKVNQRRKSLGLNTLEEQTEVIRRQSKIENQSPPIDFEKRQEEMDNWRKSVGWIS